MTPEELFNRFEKKFDGISDSIAGFSQRLTSLEVQIKASDDHRVTMTSSLGSLSTEVGELKATTRILEERYTHARTELNEAKQTVAKLEQAKWWIVGAAAGFSTAFSIVVMVVEHFLSAP